MLSLSLFTFKGDNFVLYKVILLPIKILLDEVLYVNRVIKLDVESC